MQRIDQAAGCLRHGRGVRSMPLGVYASHGSSMLDHPQVKTPSEAVKCPLGLSGILAPPLNADTGSIKFTQKPVSICPFCSPDVEWPPAIVLTYVPRMTEPTAPVMMTEVTSILGFNPSTGPASGIVSKAGLSSAGLRLA